MLWNEPVLDAKAVSRRLRESRPLVAQKLKENGAELGPELTETLWGVISRITGAGQAKGAADSGKASLGECVFHSLLPARRL